MTTMEAVKTYIPTLQDVLAARKQIAPYLSPTPFYSYPALNQVIGTTVYVKQENYLPTGAFKVRGGINFISRLSAEEKARGVITASTGNHGQSVSYAAQLFGVKARVAVPEGANPGKVASMQNMGAEVIFHGEKFDNAVAHAKALAAEYGYRFINSGNEPNLIAGVATYVLEMLEAQPDLDAIIVPVGSGGGAAGACIAAHAINPGIRVIATQSELAPAAFLSWQAREICTAENHTFAEGLATGRGFELPQQILWDQLDDFVLVSDEEIRQATVWLIQHARTLAEPAGAASLAAAYKLRHELQGHKVGIVCSGGNISPDQLRSVLAG